MLQQQPIYWFPFLYRFFIVVCLVGNTKGGCRRGYVSRHGGNLMQHMDTIASAMWQNHIAVIDHLLSGLLEFA